MYTKCCVVPQRSRAHDCKISIWDMTGAIPIHCKIDQSENPFGEIGELTWKKRAHYRVS